MLGMFVILPVFAIYAEQIPGGNDLTLVGLAIGAYGLTQAILQIPFGWLSDRYGRKPVIYFGLAVFAAGSFVAAAAPNIWIVILGRVLQGSGAISAAVIAMVADSTREQHRTKAMAMVGSTIGLTFALSLVASPWLNRLIGVPGIFALTGVLALSAMLVVWKFIPDVVAEAHDRRVEESKFRAVLFDPQLARLNYGIFALHAVLMAMFIVVPLSLRSAGLPLDAHWKVYLAVMGASFVLMLPAVFYAERRGSGKPVFVGAVALLLAAQMAMPWMLGSVRDIAFFLLMFFVAFNVLEAMLPSLISKFAPVGARGTATGIYSSIQFLGTFVGAAAGGHLYEHHGLPALFAFLASLLAVWLLFAVGMRAPVAVRTRAYPLPPIDEQAAEGLAARLAELPGVREALVVAGEGKAYLKVDAAGFDEENVLRLIAGDA
jgi:MFS family permease